MNFPRLLPHNRSADGKAGSLVDGRGHFYKPLQRGPRGDRERAFYDAVSATLRAEAGAGVSEATRLSGPWCSPVAVGSGASPMATAEAPAAADASCASSTGPASPDGSTCSSPHAPLPWRQRQLRRLFPSFKDAQQDRGPMSIAQRDETGLLSSRTIARLARDFLSGQQAHKQQQQPVQQATVPEHQAQQPERQEQPQQQPEGQEQPPQQPQPQQPQPPQPPQQEQQAGLPAAEQSVSAAAEDAEAAGQYGRSPDSDDCERTGQHLMQHFHEQQQQQQQQQQQSALGASPFAAVSGKVAAAAGGQQEAHVHVAAGSPRLAPLLSAAAPAAAGAARPASGSAGGNTSAACSPAQRRHTTEHGDEAYTRPEHAQAAALLGQPVYDLSLSAGASVPLEPVPSTAKPHRSPFMSELLHHSHPPGPQELPRASSAASLAAAGPSSAAAGAAAGGMGGGGLPAAAGRSSSVPQPPASPRGALADALAQLPGIGAEPASSCASHWLTDEEEEWERERQLAGWQGGAAPPPPTAPPASGWPRGCDRGGSGGGGTPAAVFASLPFSVRNAPLLRVIPKYYGVREHSGDGRVLLELEDLARAYRHPCIMDIKVGFRTWYPQADAAYIQRCREKDASTTQAALGFKVCGMQVFRHGAGGYWRASKRWCKTLPAELVDKALLSFAHNEHGLRPAAVYGGAAGVIAQLEALEAWFAVQRDFHFYSSSVLLLYEGDATSAEEAKVRVRMVDFAHTFEQAPNGGGSRDANFLAGLRALLARLRAVVHAQLQQELA